jgi:glutamate synthase domain-containing protein 3
MREYMALLGCRTVDEMIGRSDLLEMNGAIQFWKARGLDFTRILYRPAASPSDSRCRRAQEHALDQALDRQIMAQVQPAIANAQKVTLALPIRNVHRTVGTLISSAIAKRYGAQGLPDDTIDLRFTGAAGQSFGAFCGKGMTLTLQGEANDYLGKGLCGARLIVKPYPGATYDPAENTIAGNVLLYGATSGEVYIHGRAGERFAIRNSGAHAVVEGVGDHGCEYMTGGRVVILGPTGVNFAAGMSGGIAYVYDDTGEFDGHCNLEMVDLELVTAQSDAAELRGLIERHAHYTGSAKAAGILKNWERCLPRFVKVFPMEYRRVLGKMSREDEATEREERAHV